MPFACQMTAQLGCFCLTSIKTSGRKLLLGCICIPFHYLSSGIKTYRDRNHWQGKHITGMDVEVLSGWVKQLESLTSEIQANCFSVLSLQSFPSHEIHWRYSITHTNTTVSSSSDVMAQKDHSFLSCYFKSNQFLFGSSEIYANVWAQSPSYVCTGPHPGKTRRGGGTVFS